MEDQVFIYVTGSERQAIAAFLYSAIKKQMESLELLSGADTSIVIDGIVFPRIAEHRDVRIEISTKRIVR